MAQLLRFLRSMLNNAGTEPKETWAALGCIGLLWAMTVVVYLTWGPQP